ncbi:hypothetical protein Ae168Ps1_2274c [Pseudonocardia sp. Ae168_Ps1]|nr:hypothetical protein Ae150APs1_2267c [Pseudonocardia sp. Ae150A_Ps1]OLL79868.1 hypothetical protein Ae168Ps1_2274c [Pseudonocardia sp. Ae168_Ps1]
MAVRHRDPVDDTRDLRCNGRRPRPAPLTYQTSGVTR